MKQAIHTRQQQRGISLILTVLLIFIAGSTILFSLIDGNDVARERNKTSANALAKAKEVLISRAMMDASVPGSLPCPSSSDDGTADLFAGNVCPTYIGRFPWKTLDTDDIRDGYAERLWYVLSPAFRDHPVVQPLNYDTSGTLSVDDRNDIVAIIVAPGPPISQSRPSNNAYDYLEGTNSDGDNVYSTVASAALNDRLITITRDELMQAVEKRVAAEVLYCLKEYNQNPNLGVGDGNLDRHPWTTDGVASYPNYSDIDNRRFGRIPDEVFGSTQSTSSGVMSGTWPATCNIDSTNWWSSWKEFVFYAVAYDKDPESFASPACNNDVSNDCLSVITPSGTQIYKKVVVIVSGKALPGQLRNTTARKRILSNYLEGNNASSTAATRSPSGEDAVFEQRRATSTFNDVTVFN